MWLNPGQEVGDGNGWWYFGMAGGVLMFISATAAPEAAAQSQAGPGVSEQIEMVETCLDFWYQPDVWEGIEDEADWLRIVTDLEEMLKDLQQE